MRRNKSKLLPVTDEDIDRYKYTVIFCHGQTHREEAIPEWFMSTHITMVDSNPDVYPDVVGKFSSFKTLNDLGLFRYDYVTGIHCPVYLGLENARIFIRGARWLLKKGGELIFPHFLLILARQISKELRKKNSRELEKTILKDYQSQVETEIKLLILEENYSDYRISNEDVIFVA